MRQSRYVWLLAILGICLAGMVWWYTPERIIGVMANPHMAFTPRATVHIFWNLLDSRQVELAQELIDIENANNLAEFERWKQTLTQNPLLTLSKLEFIESEHPGSLIVRVTWRSSLKEEINETYLFNLAERDTGWVIKSMERVSGLTSGIS